MFFWLRNKKIVFMFSSFITFYSCSRKHCAWNWKVHVFFLLAISAMHMLLIQIQFTKKIKETRSKQKAAIVALEMHLSGAWSLQSCFALETEKNGEIMRKVFK
jgi:hypothetical protein